MSSRAVPRGVPSWQEDDTVLNCPICHNKFTLFFRRHHCRKCGRVVCGNCSESQSTYLPTTYVVSPPSQIFLESPHVPHRTCDECMEELDMIRTALRATYRSRDQGGGGRVGATGATTGASNYNRRQSNSSGSHRSGRPSGSDNRGFRRESPGTYTQESASKGGVIVTGFEADETLIQTVGMDLADDDDRCPVCGSSLEGRSEEERESHVNQCLNDAQFSGYDKDSHRRNRMIIYKIPERECDNLDECVICFEEFHPGDTVGRLECLCVYHEACILGWFARKGAGSCPVHAVHE